MADNGQADGPGPLDDEGIPTIAGDADNDPVDVDAIPAPPPPPNNPEPLQANNPANAALQGPQAAGQPQPPDDDPAAQNPNPHEDVSDSEPDSWASQPLPGHCATVCRPRWQSLKAKSHWRKGLCRGLRRQRDGYRRQCMDLRRTVRLLERRIRSLEEANDRLRGRRRLKTAPVSSGKNLRDSLLTHKYTDLARRIAARARNRRSLPLIMPRSKQFTSLTPRLEITCCFQKGTGP